MVAVKAFSK